MANPAAMGGILAGKQDGRRAVLEALALILGGGMAVLLGFVALMLYGFTGVLRAAFWSRAYRRLGGATSDDRLGGVGVSPG